MIERIQIVTDRLFRFVWLVVAPLLLTYAGTILTLRLAPGSDEFRLALGMLLPVPLWVAATCVSVVDGTTKRFILATALASAGAALT